MDISYQRSRRLTLKTIELGPVKNTQSLWIEDGQLLEVGVKAGRPHQRLARAFP